LLNTTNLELYFLLVQISISGLSFLAFLLYLLVNYSFQMPTVVWQPIVPSSDD